MEDESGLGSLKYTMHCLTS